MSTSNPSLHANAAPQHFEQIAKILQSKRNIGDSSTCDVKIQLKNGYDMVHSMVVCAHSTVFSDALEPQRAPYQPFDMKDFDSDSVKKVIDWMYSGEIDIPENSIADVLAVASFLRVTMLQRQIEQKIRNHSGSPILALNIASVRAFSVMDDTMNRLVHDLTEKVSGLSVEEVSKLTINSVIAVMAAVLPMQKKVPLINMFILWIMTKKPEKETINTILQSLVISDITYDALYAIRYSLKQYLTNLEMASKSQLTISPSGTIDIKIATKKITKPASNHSNSIPQSSIQPPRVPSQFHRTVSEIQDIRKLPDPFQSKTPDYRTISEIEDIRNIPDPFEKSARISTSNSVLRRETNNGFPKLFTRSEVENLQLMTDPFNKSEKEKTPRTPKQGNHQFVFSSTKCTAKYPSWSEEIVELNKKTKLQGQEQLKYTPSQVQEIHLMPDPFVRPPPVIMRPAVGNKVSSNRLSIQNDNSNNGFPRIEANQSFSGHSLNDNNNNFGHRNQEIFPNPVLSTISCVSPNINKEKSVIVQMEMVGPRKTESEIREINALPSFHSASFHTAKTSNLSGHSAKGNKSEKSLKSQKSQESQKSQKSAKKIPRSQYLYPN